MDTQTIDYSGQRLREVTAWLRARVEYDEVVRQHAEEARAAAEFHASKEWRRANRMGLWGWIIFLGCGFWILWPVSTLMNFRREPDPGPKSFEEWHAAHAHAGDELWEYDSGTESWEQLAGECGFALVRDGRVFEIWMVANN